MDGKGNLVILFLIECCAVNGVIPSLTLARALLKSPLLFRSHVDWVSHELSYGVFWTCNLCKEPLFM